MTQRPTLGILGGMGPAATAYCYEVVIAQTPAQKDQDHIPTLIYSNPKIPNRTDSIESGETTAIAAALIHTAQTLESAGATVIIMPCNTAHYWAHDIENSLQIPFINMITATANDIAKKGHQNIGLLATTGTKHTQLFDTALAQHNIQIHHPSDDNQPKVMDLISTIKADPTTTANTHTTTELLALFDTPVDAFILGCTELSYLYKNTPDPQTIDPIKAVVSRAIQIIQTQ